MTLKLGYKPITWLHLANQKVRNSITVLQFSLVLKNPLVASQ